MNSTGPVDDKDIDPSHGNVANSSGTFSFGVRLGLVFVVQIASISAVLVSGLLSYILWQAIKSYRRRRTWHWPSHIHIYFISLLCSDFIQAVGAIMDTAWIHDAGVVEGPFCTAQGMIEQIGDVGVALAILAIAVSTWGHIVLHWTTAPSPKVALVIVSLIWSFVILVTSISLGVHRNRVDPYYGNTKYWCWIRSPTYWKDGIALEYAWMWMTALVNILLYIPVTITLLKSRRQKKALALDSVVYREKDPHERSIQTMAFQMSLYPVIYIITVS
ncbi:hypothetical protein SISSUDRAFT_477102 [Sistotremastrum suecicum HHB10207 ss-3]|uniref:Glucose receptor Git3 N-terminal domain-containing protein n=1 Tax=Sistotremastrum suecicum HHB10207 ss-3 TaxID=1314776 RepID=A0A166FAC8_9AGAM|nr:hypothetical protein SISSUDRAFT_477102 [Sistotremastrum suecicum HHB10207 ss-3]